MLTAKEYVGLFCVAKNDGKQRLIVERMRAAPATPLATSESFSQFSVTSPGCDPHGPKAQRIYTHSSATVVSCDVENCFHKLLMDYIAASASGSHSQGGVALRIWVSKAGLCLCFFLGVSTSLNDQ